MIKNEDNGKDCRIVTTPAEVLEQFEAIFETNPRLGGTLLLKSNAGLPREALGHILAAAR